MMKLYFVFHNVLKFNFEVIYLFFFYLLTIFGFVLLYFRSIMLFGSSKDKIKYEPFSGTLPSNNFFKSLFWDLPYMIGYDLSHQDPNQFKNHGLVIFCGRQGYGKTISMIKYATDLKMKYPRSKVLSNTKFTFQDLKLNHWKQLCNYNNGIYGVICIIDELQNWFNSKQSKNFPPEMLSVVTQNRKNRRVILGTAQSFYMISKDIRSQCTEVRNCRTLFGVLTFVVRYEPVLSYEGDVEKMLFKGFYYFIQSKQLRESYDTYSVIKNLTDSGFVEKKEVNLLEKYTNK